MRNRIIACLMCICMIFMTFDTAAFATVSGNSLTVSGNSAPEEDIDSEEDAAKVVNENTVEEKEEEIKTVSGNSVPEETEEEGESLEIPACSCGNEANESLSNGHANSCERRMFAESLCAYTALEIYNLWDDLSEAADVREHVLTYLSWTDYVKLEELKGYLENDVEEPDQPEVPEIPDAPELPDMNEIMGECSCALDDKYGSLLHDKECPWHFANLPVEVEYMIYISLSDSAKEDVIRSLSTDQWAKLESYINEHPFTSTVAEDGTSVLVAGAPAGVSVTAESMDHEFTESIMPRMVLGNEAGFVLDVTMTDSEGNEWQPESGKEVMVKVSLPETTPGQKTDFIHILDHIDKIEAGLANGNVKLLDLSNMFYGEDENGEVIETTPDLSEEYWKALNAAEELGYEKQIAYEIITGVTTDAGYVTLYTESFSTFSTGSLNSGTYYINHDLSGWGSHTGAGSNWKGFYSEDGNKNSQLHDYYYTEIGNVTIASGNTVDIVFVSGDVPVSGTVTVNGTLNMYLLREKARFYAFHWSLIWSGYRYTNDSYTVTPTTMYRKSGNTASLISVGSNGTLNLSGTSENSFIIDGKSISGSESAIHSTGKLNLDYVTITNNHSSGNGGAVNMGGTAANTLDYVNISNCKGTDGSAIFIQSTSGSLTANYCNITGCESPAESWGGAVRTTGLTVSTTTFNNCNIYKNKSGCHGGAFYWNAGGASKLTLNNCDIYSNTAGNKGGAIFCEAVMEIKGNTKIHNNTADQGGGGICVNAYGGGTPGATGSQLILADTISIYNNTTSASGGGIFMNIHHTDDLDSNAVFKIQLNGAQVYNNTAAVSGGGIYVTKTLEAGTEGYQCSADLNYGKFENNIATGGNGGGIYASNINITIGNTSGNEMLIKGNKAINGIGGAVYSAGTVGTCSISNGTLTSNSAKYGGAIGAVDSIVSVNGGTIKSNDASYCGGAIYASGSSSNVSVTGTSAIISENEAANGGAIYATAGGKVNVSGGIISKNRAVGTPTVTTAYNDAATAGVGGGIYVGNGADASNQSSVTIVKPVGIYDNTADFAASDAYASGVNTSMSLPDVANMNLTGYDGTATGWYEDYVTGDTGYNNGLKGGTEGERYTKARNTIEVSSASGITKYAAITLGKTIKGYGNLTIEKTGTNIDPNQVFLFKIKNTKTNEEMEVSVKGTGSITVYGLVDGTYEVSEDTNWSWKYTPSPGKQEVTISGTNVNPTATFTNALTNSDWVTSQYQVINEKK